MMGVSGVQMKKCKRVRVNPCGPRTEDRDGALRRIAFDCCAVSNARHYVNTTRSFRQTFFYTNIFIGHAADRFDAGVCGVDAVVVEDVPT